MRLYFYIIFNSLVFLLLDKDKAFSQEQTSKPNVIVVVVDDMGYGDPSVFGRGFIETPNIEELAKKGISASSAYVTAPVCGPSRAGLILGAYQQRFGNVLRSDHWSRHKIPKTHPTLPEMVKKAGYRTGVVGKWGIEQDAHSVFDNVYDLIYWEADYFPDSAGNYVGVNQGKGSRKVHGMWGPERYGDEYLTDRLTRHAIEFIADNRDTSFFLYLGYNAVHSPWQADVKYKEKFKEFPNEPLRMYAAMLASLDDNIGKLVAYLKTHNLFDNTAIILISDNGPTPGGKERMGWPSDWPQEEFIVGSAGPLRGQKAEVFEGGIRVPFIFHWPSKFPVGFQYEHPITSMDIYPTVCSIIGAEIPAKVKIDGVDLLPYFNGYLKSPPHEHLFWSYDGLKAVRYHDWKLVTDKAGNNILFNLKTDEAEKYDVSSLRPSKAEQLKKIFSEWETRTVHYAIEE